jgi:hypothetical protein
LFFDGPDANSLAGWVMPPEYQEGSPEHCAQKRVPVLWNGNALNYYDRSSFRIGMDYIPMRKDDPAGLV